MRCLFFILLDCLYPYMYNEHIKYIHIGVYLFRRDMIWLSDSNGFWN